LIQIVGWGNLQGNGFDLINWDINGLGEFIECILVCGFATYERFRNWGWLWCCFLGNGNLNFNLLLWDGNCNLCDSNKGFNTLLVMFFVVLFSSFLVMSLMSFMVLMLGISESLGTFT